MERLEEFELEGKRFLYINLSSMKDNDEFLAVTRDIKAAIAKYPENSIYTITNVKGIKFDSETKKYLPDFLAHNKPYVIHGIIFGMDGVIRIMAKLLLKLTWRENMQFAFSKEQAIELLLQQKQET